MSLYDGVASFSSAKSRPFTPTDRPLPAKWHVKERFENPTASERSAKSRSLMRTKFEDCKNKKLSSQFKTQKAVGDRVEFTSKLKKAVGDRVEFTSKLKKLSSQFKTQESCWRSCRVHIKTQKGCRVHIKTQKGCRVHIKTQRKVTGPGKMRAKESLRSRGRAQSQWRCKSEKLGWSAGWTKETTKSCK